MSENSPPSDQPGGARRFTSFLYRLLRAALIVLLFMGLLAGVAWGGLWLYQTISGEISRTAESAAIRFEAQEARIDTLRREMDGLLAAAPDQAQQVGELQQQVGSLESSIARLTTDATEKGDLLAALESALADNQAADASAAESITELAEALTALQTDFNLSTGQLDTLGGELDEQAGQVAEIQATLAAVVAAAETASAQAEEAATAVTEMARSLILFHAWELVARARLHLLSDNVGLAAVDVDTAQQTIATLQAQLTDNEEVLAASLDMVQTRLQLAASNLPGAPELAARDLESVWDALDDILVARLLPQEVEAELEDEEGDEP
jgi:chromosome segregation ATPase